MRRARSRSRSRVGSAPERAPRSRRFAPTAPRRCRATRSSITCSAPISTCATALVERFGEAILDDDGVPDRSAIAAVVFDDAEALAFLEALLHPLVSREYLSWREQLAELDDPPAVCVTEVPLLYESGGEIRFDRVVVITAPRQLREQRRQVPLDNRDARLLDDREKVAKADFHYVNTGTLRGPRRLGRRRHGGADERRTREAPRPVALAGVAVLGGVVGSRSLRHQPDFVQRIRYPLRYEQIVRGHAENYDLDPALPRRRDLHREHVQRGRPLRCRRDRPDAAAARHGARDRRPHRRQRLRRRRSLRAGAERPLRRVVPAQPARPLRRRAHGARRVPRRARATSTAGASRESGSSSPRPGDYVAKVERVKTIYADSTPTSSASTSVAAMADPRDRAYAELIVDGCLGVQPGWQVLVGGNPQARPLLEEVCGAVARRGAYALLRVSFEGFLAQSLELGRRTRRSSCSGARPRRSSSTSSKPSTRCCSSRRPTTRAPRRAIESERMGALQAAYRPASSRMMNHDIPWVACQYPTAALAQEAGLGTEELRRAALRRRPARLGCRGRAHARHRRALRRGLRGAHRRRRDRSAALASRGAR